MQGKNNKIMRLMRLNTMMDIVKTVYQNKHPDLSNTGSKLAKSGIQ